MFEEFLGKSVRIIQTDGWVKYGTVRTVGGGALSLEFNDGRINTIREDSIRDIVEVRE